MSTGEAPSWAAKQKDRDFLLHILRNPHGWSEEAVRDARKKAADELHRLWKLEAACVAISIELVGVVDENRT